jgi:predicted O-methyltransferase YrrM
MPRIQAENIVRYPRLTDYLKTHYPLMTTIGRFVKWGIINFSSMGGIFFFIIIALYVAGALIEPARWYLVGIASALLLLGGVLLALFYARSVLNRIISDQRTQVADIKKALHEMEAALRKEISELNVGNFPLFQQANRRLTKQDLKHFAEEWVPKLGLRLDSRVLAYIAHRICLAEDTCVGYLAGDVETMLLRILIARSIKEPELNILEIGTLFGVGVAMIHENCRGLFSNMHFSVIDPLIGLIGSHDKSSLDPLTKTPVIREIFIHNMQRMNIPQSDYTIIEKLSTEDEAIEQASKRRYNVLIIDADHSYSGVKHDFYNYRHLVKRGGYIIFDDYGNPRWPGLTAFVDKEVAEIPELEFVGTDVFTAVFRVISTPGLMKS